MENLKSWFFRCLRTFNAPLLYPISRPEKTFRTVGFLIAQFFYRRHLRTGKGGLVVIDRVDQTLKLQVDLKFTIGAAFYFIGFHEWTTWRFLHRALRPEMVFFDIGANQGEYALFAAKRLTKGQVYAVEPLPTMIEKINYNTSLNGFTNLEILPFGLAATNGEARLFDSPSANEGLASLYVSEERSIPVATIALRKGDEVVQEKELQRLDMIKIDVEGAELEVLIGLEATLRQFRPVLIIELSAVTFQAAGYTPQTVIQWLAERAYQPYRVTRSGGLEPLTSEVEFENVVFQPDRSKE